MLFLYLFVGLIVWIAVVTVNYGSLDQIPGFSEILSLRVKKDSFTGSTNELIDQFFGGNSSNKNKKSSKNFWDSVIEEAWKEPNTVTNYVGYFLILLLWPLILILAHSRHLLKTQKDIKKLCFILICFAIGLIVSTQLAFRLSSNYLTPSPSVQVQVSSSSQSIPSTNAPEPTKPNSSELSSQNKKEPLGLIEATRKSRSLAAVAQESELDYFRDAVNQAGTAANLAQTAQSKQEWTEVALLWNKALLLMKEVPASSPNYAISQDRVNTYRENREIAKKKMEMAR